MRIKVLLCLLALLFLVGAQYSRYSPPPSSKYYTPPQSSSITPGAPRGRISPVPSRPPPSSNGRISPPPVHDSSTPFAKTDQGPISPGSFKPTPDIPEEQTQADIEGMKSYFS